jgi:hypothetical protein
VVFSGSVTAGNFDGIAVDVAGTEAVLKKSGKPAAVKTVITPLKLAFPVKPGGKTVVIIDLVVFDMSDHPPRGYELSVRGYEVWVNGKARDKVPPA